MNKKQIKDLALSNGFKLKEQSNGDIDLNPYVYDFADALLAKANERVKELESVVAAAIHAFDAYEMDVDTYPTIEHVMLKNNLQSHLNKFAIEKKIEGAYAVISLLDETKDSKTILMANNYVREQLRKEQE